MARFTIALLSGGVLLTMTLSGCSTSGAMRVAGIGASDLVTTTAPDGTTGGGDGGTGTGGDEGSKGGAVMTDISATGSTGTTGGTGGGTGGGGSGGGGGSTGGGGGTSGGSGGSGRGGSGGGGTPARASSLPETILVTAGNAVLTGSDAIGGIEAPGAVATVRGTVTQLLDRTGTALVDLGNGQSAVIQQAGATIGSLINVATPAGALLPNAGRPGAVGVALLAPDPALGTVVAVSVLPTDASGQLATAMIAGAPLTSAIASTGGAIATAAGGALATVPGGLVVANVAGASVGGAQPLIAVNALTPAETPGTIATASLLPAAAASPGQVVAAVTQAVGAVAAVVPTPALTAPATPALAPVSVAAGSTLTAPVTATVTTPLVTATVAPSVTAPVTALVAPAATPGAIVTAAAGPAVAAPVTAVVSPVAPAIVAQTVGAATGGLALGGLRTR